MAQLSNSNAHKFRSLGIEDPLSETPEPTLKDRLLKALIKKQLETSVSVVEAISGRQFCHATIQDSSIKQGGLQTLEQFKLSAQNTETQEILTSCGLSKDEISTLLTGDTGRNEIPDYKKRKLEYIESKLEKRLKELENNEPETFSNAIPLSKEDLEIERGRISMNQDADKLSQCLIRPQNSNDLAYPMNHPIHTLPELEKRLFPTSVGKDKSSCRRRKKKRLNTVNSALSQNKRVSLWDVRAPIVKESASHEPSESTKSVSYHSQPIVVEKNRNFTCTDYSKPFVWPGTSLNLIKLSDIESNRVSLSDLKALPRFQSYEQGVPSTTLYVKNIRCSAEELASVFGNFEDPKSLISYRLCKGRMKGQAFITFSTIDQASRALLTCNGYILNQKPMVVAFGKQHSS